MMTQTINLKKILLLWLPIAAAYVPLGMALGLFFTASDIAWYWAPIACIIIYAGSIEYLAVSFISGGVSLFTVAFTTFVVNFRHIFYGLSFPYHRLTGRLQKFYGIWALTDEIYGVTSAGKGKQLNGREITVLQILAQCTWVSSATIGALLGLIVPPEIGGFEFALTAMFIVLAIDAVKEAQDFRLLIYVALSAIIGLVVERFMINDSFLSVALIAYLACIMSDYKKRKIGQKNAR